MFCSSPLLSSAHSNSVIPLSSSRTLRFRGLQLEGCLLVRGKEPVENALWSQVRWNPWELGEEGI